MQNYLFQLEVQLLPNHALGGSTNIVVNVDASGSNVEGDEEQGRELGRIDYQQLYNQN